MERLCVALGLALSAHACAAPEPLHAGFIAAEPSPGQAPLALSARAAAPASQSLEPGDTSPPARRTTCSPPSLEANGELDARGPGAFARCPFKHGGDEERAPRCGVGDVRAPYDLARLEEAVLGFDAATRAHVRTVAERGARLGQRPRSFGLVGDSMTTTPAFLRGFTGRFGEPIVLDPGVRASLRDTVEGDPERTIIDYYRGVDVQLGLDAFAAERAAKVGVVAEWVLAPHAMPRFSPLGLMVARLRPSVVFVTLGSNDAGGRFLGLRAIAERFEAELGLIVDYLEEAGVVPVLTTLPRHTDDVARPDCSPDPNGMSDWQLAVQTNVISAAAAHVACTRHLPLVDLRAALEGLVNHGIGRDGVHPTNHILGNAVLDHNGLQCGNNVRNFLALRMLKQLKDELAPAAAVASALATP